METLAFSDLIIDKTKDGTKLPTNDYQKIGSTAIIDQGQEFIAGYTDRSEGIFTDVPVIIFGDHTRVFKYIDFPFFLGADGVKILKANREVNYRYLYYYFLQAKFPNTGYARHFKWLKELQIPLPPLAEQKHITAILDKTQKIIAEHKQMLQKYDTLIKSRFIEMFGDPTKNTKKWEIKKLGDIIRVLGGYAFSSKDFKDSGIPVLRIGNINSGVFRPSNMVFWENDETIEKYAIYPGDLVMSLTGTVGKDDYGNVCILGNDYNKYYLNQRNAKLEIVSDLDRFYLSYLLKVPEIKSRLTNISRGIRQANIANKDIESLKIPVPPITLQNDFATFVQQIDKSKSAVQKSLEKTETLYKSLMQQYFG